LALADTYEAEVLLTLDSKVLNKLTTLTNELVETAAAGDAVN